MGYVTLPGPVKATPVDDVLASEVAGCYQFEEAVDQSRHWGWLWAKCPCGCGSFSRLPIGLNTKPDRVDGFATWQWDGDRDAPTLAPSIHHINHWHGHLKKGHWVQA